MANNKIQLKRTFVPGRTPNTTISSNSQYIAAGELALNLTDKKLYTSDGTNLITFNSNESSGSNGSAYSNTTISSSQSFDGDGISNTFTLSRSATTDSCLVTINGLVQKPDTHYSISNTSLSFTSIPYNGSIIEVINLRSGYNIQVISGTIGDTSYQLDRNVVSERDVLVTINGLLLTLGVHYNITSNVITFTSALDISAQITIIYFSATIYSFETFMVANAYATTIYDRWYPPSTITIDSIDAFTGDAVSGNLVFKVFKHDNTLNTNTTIINPITSNDSFIISSGNYRLSPLTIANTSLTSDDYISYQITDGSAKNLNIRLRYK